MTTEGYGGWHLVLVCAECSAEATYKGVVPDLAHDRAVKAGWRYAASTASVSAAEPVLGLCPKEPTSCGP